MLGFILNLQNLPKNPKVINTSFAQTQASLEKLPSISPTKNSQSTEILTPTPTSTSTYSPTPTLFFTATPFPTQTIQFFPTDLQKNLLNALNQYRTSKGLSTVSMESEVCDFAKTRSQEIASNFNHDGFTKRIESKTLPYKSYSLVTENIVLNSSSSQIIPMWISSPPHAENMRKDTPFVCIENFGNYYVYEGWKP